MRIKIQQFLFGKCHSWALVGQNLGRALIKMGHEVDFVSTDGFNDKYCPQDLKPYVKIINADKKNFISEVSKLGNYDCQISYTAPHNWPVYLINGSKNRFGIWNYEYNNKKFTDNYRTLLSGFAKHYHACDMVLPSSNFTKEVFTSMGIPESHMTVIPHGINIEDYSKTNSWKLKTTKSKKILLNIAQPHRRKALPLALKAFGKAFNKNDDVVLVAKVFKQNKGQNQFDVDFDNIYKTFEKNYPNHAEVELVYNYIDNIADIYSSCDINFSCTHAECWHLPSLEALASGIINVVPNYGGQLDFCNNSNSLLIDGKIVRAPRDHQYWNFNPYAVHFEVDVDDAAEKLKLAVKDYNSLVTKFKPSMIETVSKFTWENAAKGIIDLCK
jgi:glycosyltransferase involved in cell wall biosynthesis